MLRAWLGFTVAGLLGAISACAGAGALTTEQAASERAAIEQAVNQEAATLCAAAAVRARAAHAELFGKRLACVVSDANVRFTTASRAHYTLSYQCGVAPWARTRTRPAATTSIDLDMLKENGHWGINGFL